MKPVGGRLVQNNEWIYFMSKAMGVAKQFGGTVAVAEAKPYLTQLYEDWKHSGVPFGAVIPWLTERMKVAFQSIGDPPVWVEDEGTWGFHGARPMVFISQADVGVAKAGVDPLSPGEHVYLFGIREPVERSGFEMINTTLTQFSPL